MDDLRRPSFRLSPFQMARTLMSLRARRRPAEARVEEGEDLGFTDERQTAREPISAPCARP
jgi:hypothetical protein